MSLGKARSLLVLLMLLTLVGQALATAVLPHCIHRNNNNPPLGTGIVTVLQAEHAKMDKNSGCHSTVKADEQGHCQQDCRCLMGSCQSTAVPMTLAFGELAATAQEISPPIVLVNSQAPSSLYRPPILA